MDETVILEVVNLEKRYDKSFALRNLNAKFSPGIYGLLGPNGAGKSTLMNILSDVLPQTSGQVLINGKDIQNVGDAYRAHLGVVPQQQRMYGFFTAYEFLEYMAALKGIDRRDAPSRIYQCLEQVELLDQANMRISTYSGGMKQRLLLAQAILNDPKILILDEPTAGLDPRQRIVLRNLIAKIGMDKIVIFATHVVSDLESIAKEVLLLQKGQLLDRGSVEYLCRRVQGRVVEVVVERGSIGGCACWGKIVSFLPFEGKAKVRILVDKNKPMEPGMTEVQPTLEEVYLDCFED